MKNVLYGVVFSICSFLAFCLIGLVFLCFVAAPFVTVILVKTAPDLEFSTLALRGLPGIAVMLGALLTLGFFVHPPRAESE